MGLSILILVTAFFTVNNVRDSITSMCRQTGPNISRIDIEILQNPSPYTQEMIAMIDTLTMNCGHNNVSRIKGHYISSENLEAILWQVQLGLKPQYYKDYDLVALSEGDVVLEDGSLSECVNILSRVSKSLRCTVSVNMTAGQNPPVPNIAFQWKVPVLADRGFYLEGPTNFCFVLFRSNDLRLFFDLLRQQFISGHIALGAAKYHHVSDVNLHRLEKLLNFPSIRTKYHMLNHIGWQNYIDMDNNKYVQYRKKQKYFRQLRNHLISVLMCPVAGNISPNCLNFSEPCFFADKFDCNDPRRNYYDFNFKYKLNDGFNLRSIEKLYQY